MTLAEQVGSLRRALYLTMTRRLAAETKCSLQQLSALCAVGRREVCTQAELAARLLIDAPAASRLVDRLEQDGYLRRETGSDRRCVKLVLTGEGGREVAKLEDALSWMEGEMKHHLTPEEMKTLGQLLGKLQAGVSASR